MHWMILPLKRYFDFKGRSRRMEYWMFFLLNMIVGVVLIGPFFFSTFGILMDSAASGASDEAAELAMLEAMSGAGGISFGLFGIWALATFIPNIAVTVRRLHDRDMSGWWYPGIMLASLIPFIGFIASIGFLVLMFLPGTDGANRFGPDPKNPYEEDIFA